MNQDKLVPILAGGAFIGITSAFPFVNLLNLCCCLLIISGGVLTSFLYINRSAGTEVTMGDGALLGLLAGFVGAVVEAIMSIPLAMLQTAMFDTSDLVEVLRQSPDLPPEFAEALATVAAGGVGGGLMIVSLIISLVIMGLFSCVGGILGVAIFNKTPAAPAAPAPVASYAPPQPMGPPPAAPPAVVPPATTSEPETKPESGSDDGKDT